jgi:hypothetical protein
MPAIDIAALDPYEVEWADLGPVTRGGGNGSQFKSSFLRMYPGRWFLVGLKPYKGGFSKYTCQGFKHAVRKAEGGWNHYLSWPDEAGMAGA